jgi:hypothetical protein
MAFDEHRSWDIQFHFYITQSLTVYLLRLCRSFTPALTWRSTNAVPGASNFISRSHNVLSYTYCVYVGVLLLLWHGVPRTPLVVSFTPFLEFRYLNTDLMQRRSSNTVLLASIFISRSHKDSSYTYCVYAGVLLLLWHGVPRTPLVVGFEIFPEFRYLNTDLLRYLFSFLDLRKTCRTLTASI